MVFGVECLVEVDCVLYNIYVVVVCKVEIGEFGLYVGNECVDIVMFGVLYEWIDVCGVFCLGLCDECVVLSSVCCVLCGNIMVD